MKKILLAFLSMAFVFFAFSAPPTNQAIKAELAKKHTADIKTQCCPEVQYIQPTIVASSDYDYVSPAIVNPAVADQLTSGKYMVQQNKKAEANSAADAVSLGVDATADIVANNAKTQTQPCPELSNVAQPDCVQLE